jgi:hypothetical protein
MFLKMRDIPSNIWQTGMILLDAYAFFIRIIQYL